MSLRGRLFRAARQCSEQLNGRLLRRCAPPNTYMLLASAYGGGALDFGFSGFSDEGFKRLAFLEAVKASLGARGFENLSHRLGRQGAVLHPMENTVFLDVNGGGIGAGIVHTQNFQKAAIAGDSLSAATMRYVGWPLRPIRRKRILPFYTYSLRLYCVSDRRERVV